MPFALSAAPRAGRRDSATAHNTRTTTGPTQKLFLLHLTAPTETIKTRRILGQWLEQGGPLQ